MRTVCKSPNVPAAPLLGWKRNYTKTGEIHDPWAVFLTLNATHWAKEKLLPYVHFLPPSVGCPWHRCHHSVCPLGELHQPGTGGLQKCPYHFKSGIKTVSQLQEWPPWLMGWRYSHLDMWGPGDSPCFPGSYPAGRVPGGVLIAALMFYLLFMHVWHTVCSLSMVLETNHCYVLQPKASVVFVFLGASTPEPCADIKSGSTRTNIYHHSTSASNGIRFGILLRSIFNSSIFHKT